MTYSLCTSNTLSGAYSILWALLTKTQGGEKSILSFPDSLLLSGTLCAGDNRGFFRIG